MQNILELLGGANIHEQKAQLKKLEPWRKGVYKMRRAQVDEALEEAETPGYLVNNGRNSCYLDSVWVAFFASQQQQLARWINKHWLKDRKDAEANADQLRQRMRQIYSKVLGIDIYDPKKQRRFTCRGLRQTLANLPPRQGDDTEWLYTQNDPNDVLQALIHTFQMKADIQCMRTTPSGTKKTKAMFNGILVGIDMLHNKKRISLKKCVFDVYRDSEHTSMVIQDAQVMYIPVTRNFLNEDKLTTAVHAPYHATLASGTTLELVGIIVHHGHTPTSGHYTCYMKRGGEWWHYDDLSSSFKFVKSVKDSYIAENAVGFLYTSV